MPYQKIKRTELPKRKRNSIPRFSKTDEWKAMKADIDKGLTPHQAAVVTLSKADLERYKIKDPRTISRFIQDYFREKDLRFHTVKKQFIADGVLQIVVVYTPVIRQRA